MKIIPCEDGSIMLVMDFSRPDLAYVINILSRLMENPSRVIRKI